MMIFMFLAFSCWIPVQSQLGSNLSENRRDWQDLLPAKNKPPAPGPGTGNAIRHGLLAKEEAEEEQRAASALHRGLAAVPELIGFHIGR